MKSVIHYIFLITTLVSISACNKELAPDPEAAFLKLYGGEGNQMAGALEQTPDGGYIIIGTSDAFSGDNTSDLFLVKADERGNVLWQKTYGGPLSDSGFSVKNTSDGGYILLGNYMNTNETDMYAFKVNASGNEEWNAKYDVAGGGSQKGLDVLPLSTGGYFLSGGSTRPGGTTPWFVKIDNAGNKLIDRFPPFDQFSGSNYGTSAVEVDPDNIICSAVQPQFNDRSLSIIKFNSNLGYGYGYVKSDVNILEPNPAEAAQLKKTLDGGLILVGTTTAATNLGRQVYLLKMMPNESGTGYVKSWYAEYGGAAADIGASVDVCADGGFIVTGTTFSMGDILGDVYVLKTDASGKIIWEKSFGGEGLDEGAKVICDKKGGFAVLATITWSATSGRKMISLIKLTENGSLTE